jgi:hypothetical protein
MHAATRFLQDGLGALGQPWRTVCSDPYCCAVQYSEKWSVAVPDRTFARSTMICVVVLVITVVGGRLDR